MDRIVTILFFNVISLWDCGMDTTSAERNKRVIHGSPVLDIKDTDYLAFRYFVWIANGHNCDSPLPDIAKYAFGKDRNWEFGLLGPVFFKIGIVCAPKPHHLQCTGSLLTPFLVQTACHCVVDFITRDGDNQYSKVYDATEKMFTVHPARLRVENISSDGVFSKAYIAHPKCAKEGGSLVHDYALILLDKSLATYQKGFAPIYSIQELARIWLNAMAKEKVCLIMGFGTFSWIPGEDYEDNNALKSDVLRHGWVVAMDYYQCWVKLGWLTANYTEEGTDLCAVNLDGRPGQAVLTAGKGDSGGPVSCDNQYAGLQSERIYDYLGDDSTKRIGFGRYMSTAFSIYENSIDYREELSYRIFDLYNNEQDPTTKQPKIKIFFASAPISCAPTTISPNFIIYLAVIYHCYNVLKQVMEYYATQ